MTTLNTLRDMLKDVQRLETTVFDRTLVQEYLEQSSLAFVMLFLLPVANRTDKHLLDLAQHMCTLKTLGVDFMGVSCRDAMQDPVYQEKFFHWCGTVNPKKLSDL